MKNWTLPAIFGSLVFAVGGCCCADSGTASSSSNELHAMYTETPIVADGKLDEPAWQNAVVYQLDAPVAVNSEIGSAKEKGSVRLLWDDENFYIGIEFDDSDIYADGTADQLAHFLMGDLAEIFLGPSEELYYWEFYVTPKNHKTSYLLTGPRLLLPDTRDTPQLAIQTGAQLKQPSTLGDWSDVDTGWTAEIVVPRAELEKYGAKFEPGTPWRLLVARYNYSRYLSDSTCEYSTSPKISKVDYHLVDEYAALILDK